MNNIILMGRLTRDPEVRYSTGENATAVGKISIAVDRRFKRDGQPDADFFNITAFGKLGEFVEKYLKKGTKIVVKGEMHNNDYTNKDGQKIRDFQVVADSIEFAESKAASGGSNTSNDGFMSVPTGNDDELPFM